jgi:hypothetical protein
MEMTGEEQGVSPESQNLLRNLRKESKERLEALWGIQLCRPCGPCQGLCRVT